MSFTKLVGWLLLFSGILIISFSLYQSFVIFTGKKEPPEIFKIETIKTNISSLSKKKVPTSLEEVQAQLQEMMQEQIQNIIPKEAISKSLNLVSFSILAGILIFGGSQISFVGIKLLK
jgi:hypothetical protein